MYLILYFLGVIIATYLIIEMIYYNSEENMECSEFIVCYCFALLSWLLIFIILFNKFFRYLKRSKDSRFNIN